jgi:hypothetical protein
MSGRTFSSTLQDFQEQGGESTNTLYQNIHNLLDHANKRSNINYQAAEAVKEDLNEAKRILADTTLRLQQAQQTPEATQLQNLIQQLHRATQELAENHNKINQLDAQAITLPTQLNLA